MEKFECQKDIHFESYNVYLTMYIFRRILRDTEKILLLKATSIGLLVNSRQYLRLVKI